MDRLEEDVAKEGSLLTGLRKVLDCCEYNLPIYISACSDYISSKDETTQVNYQGKIATDTVSVLVSPKDQDTY